MFPYGLVLRHGLACLSVLPSPCLSRWSSTVAGMPLYSRNAFASLVAFGLPDLRTRFSLSGGSAPEDPRAPACGPLIPFSFFSLVGWQGGADTLLSWEAWGGQGGREEAWRGRARAPPPHSEADRPARSFSLFGGVCSLCEWSVLI